MSVYAPVLLGVKEVQCTGLWLETMNYNMMAWIECLKSRMY